MLWEEKIMDQGVIYWKFWFRISLLHRIVLRESTEDPLTVQWLEFGTLTERYVWASPAAGHSKASKQVRLVERKVCFISDVGNWRGRMADVRPKADSPLTNRGESFYRQARGGYMQNQRSSLSVIFKLVISGLTSIIVVVLGTVNLQFQGALTPISLWPILRIVAAQVLGAGWSPWI